MSYHTVGHYRCFTPLLLYAGLAALNAEKQQLGDGAVGILKMVGAAAAGGAVTYWWQRRGAETKPPCACN